MEILPDELYNEFNTENSTMLAVFFDTSTSADITMDAIREIRSVAGKQCFVSGMSALVTDLKDLCEKEEPIYVGIAVLLACAAMMLFLDSWLVPFVFLASIGIAIVLNLGSNFFMGEISYITKALSAVLQLAVTMDYSIFLWHSYNAQRERYPDHRDAMAAAIQETPDLRCGKLHHDHRGLRRPLLYVVYAGTRPGHRDGEGRILGRDRLCDHSARPDSGTGQTAAKTKHRPLIPNMNKFASGVIHVFPVFLILFVLLIPPAYYGYNKTNKEVYYDLGECLPEDMEYVIANSKLSEDFHIASTHMLLVDADLPSKTVRSMIDEMEQVDGVKYVLGLGVGGRLPGAGGYSARVGAGNSQKRQMGIAADQLGIQGGQRQGQRSGQFTEHDPEKIRRRRHADRGSALHEGLDRNNRPRLQGRQRRIHPGDFCNHRFSGKSLSLPFILISVIELAIFINLGLPIISDSPCPLLHRSVSAPSSWAPPWTTPF